MFRRPERPFHVIVIPMSGIDVLIWISLVYMLILRDSTLVSRARPFGDVVCGSSKSFAWKCSVSCAELVCDVDILGRIPVFCDTPSGV